MHTEKTKNDHGTATILMEYSLKRTHTVHTTKAPTTFFKVAHKHLYAQQPTAPVVPSPARL
jgi:hypothetical protein